MFSPTILFNSSCHWDTVQKVLTKSESQSNKAGCWVSINQIVNKAASPLSAPMAKTGLFTYCSSCAKGISWFSCSPLTSFVAPISSLVTINAYTLLRELRHAGGKSSLIWSVREYYLNAASFVALVYIANAAWQWRERIVTGRDMGDSSSTGTYI